MSIPGQEIRMNHVNVLNKGYVEFLNTESKEDKQLYDRLIAHKDCFFESMQVLTSSGWKYWKDLAETEELLIPNPDTHKLQREILRIYSRDIIEEKLYCCDSPTIEYKVIQDHSLWVKGKEESEYSKQKVDAVSNWGHHEASSEYSLLKEGIEGCSKFHLLGFYLGKGYCKDNVIQFHLNNVYDMRILKGILEDSGIIYTLEEEVDRKVFTYKFVKPDWFNEFIHQNDTEFRLSKIKVLEETEIKGLWEGLLQSSGKINTDETCIEFTSTTSKLEYLFETLSAFMGLDSHSYPIYEDRTGIVAFYNPEELIRDSEYLYYEQQSGKVYCATSSTGLLVVRGSLGSCGFICGDSSPVDMLTTNWNMKLPIEMMLQLMSYKGMTCSEVYRDFSEVLSLRQKLLFLLTSQNNQPICFKLSVSLPDLLHFLNLNLDNVELREVASAISTLLYQYFPKSMAYLNIY